METKWIKCLLNCFLTFVYEVILSTKWKNELIFRLLAVLFWFHFLTSQPFPLSNCNVEAKPGCSSVHQYPLKTDAFISLKVFWLPPLIFFVLLWRFYNKNVLNLKIYPIMSMYAGMYISKISLNKKTVNTVIYEILLPLDFSVIHHSICDVNTWKYWQAWPLRAHEIRTFKQTKLVFIW